MKKKMSHNVGRSAITKINSLVYQYIFCRYILFCLITALITPIDDTRLRVTLIP